MGLFDLPAPVLSWADEKLAVLLPDLVRIMVWGGVAAVLSMGLYWLASPQRRIASIADEERRLKVVLRDENLAIAEGWGSALRLLRLALSRIGLLLPAVLVAALPVVCLMTWLDARYGYDLPASGSTVQVTVEPTAFQGRWVNGGDAAPRIEVINGQGPVLHSLPVSIPIVTLAKRAWWNVLIGNPLGYLPQDSLIGRVEIGLPEKQYLAFGPDWIRGWTAPFMTALLVGSLLLRALLRLH